MKRTFICRLSVLVLVIAVSSCRSSNAISQKPVATNVTYQTFYDSLSPYGTWIDYAGYGHVWHPRTKDDFRPYATSGHWDFTTEGWAWASDYSWGWAPFHYGRWLYDDMYGWLWIPGFEWSPAWVTWGTVDNFYTWAPLMPGVDLSVQFGGWRPHTFYWNVCSRDHIYDRNLYGAIERAGRVPNIINRITIINNFDKTKTHHFYYSKGPDVHEVEKYVSHKIHQTSFGNVLNVTGEKHIGNVRSIFRPSIQDPKETALHNPHQSLQPAEFKKVDVTHARPIINEDQRPTVGRSEHNINLERLPFHSSERRADYRAGGRVQHRGRN